MIALAIGRFDVARLTRRARRAEGKVSAYRHEGASVWAFQPDASQKEAAARPTAMALTSLARGVLLLGSQRRIETALANRKRGLLPLRSNELIVRLAEKVRPGSTSGWSATGRCSPPCRPRCRRPERRRAAG